MYKRINCLIIHIVETQYFASLRGYFNGIPVIFVNKAMKRTSNYLFVYGSLLDERNEFAFYLKENCSFYKKAKFKGMLYDIGAYPGATFQPGSEGFVYGSIFKMNDLEAVLRKLDEYEGFGEDQPQPNEFIRQLLYIETADKPIKCWVYLYNLPVDGLRQITSGNYFSSP